MSPSYLRVFILILRHPLTWLAVVSLLITLYLSALQPDTARAFQSSSPLPTDTPPPTLTPIPTTPAATSTPFFTATPLATPFVTATGSLPTTTLPTATVPIFATLTPSDEFQTPPPDFFTPTPPLFETPVGQPTILPLPSDTPFAPFLVVTATPPPVLTPTEVLTATIVITETGGGAPPAQNADTLVDLIDTFVLYSAYFLLGCGVIVFVALAVGFFYLNRRARTLQ